MPPLGQRSFIRTPRTPYLALRQSIDTELMAQTFISLFYGRAYRDSLTTGLDADLLKRQMLQLYAAITNI